MYVRSFISSIKPRVCGDKKQVVQRRRISDVTAFNIRLILWFINLSKYISPRWWMWNAAESYLRLKMETHCSQKQWWICDMTLEEEEEEVGRNIPDSRRCCPARIRFLQQAFVQNQQLLCKIDVAIFATVEFIFVSVVWVKQPAPPL